MSSAKRTGRTIGVMLLAQAAIAPVVNFVLMGPVIRPPGFLVTAAGHASQVRIAVLLGLLAGAITIGVAAVAVPLFRRYSETMAILYLALGIVGFSTVVTEQTSVLSMLSLSQQSAQAAGATELFQALAKVAAARRNWAHYTNLLVGGATILALYGVLYRFALVPRALAAFGMIAAVLQMTAVTMPILGYPVAFILLAPLGLTHLLLVVWLIAKGFTERPPVPALDVDARPAGL